METGMPQLSCQFHKTKMILWELSSCSSDDADMYVHLFFKVNGEYPLVAASVLLMFLLPEKLVYLQNS